MATLAEIKKSLRVQQDISTHSQLTVLDSDSLEYNDISVSINWRDVVRILDDVLLSVSMEGQFRSEMVRDALSVVDIAVSLLAESAGQAENRIAISSITWTDRLLSLFPGSSGNRIRNIISRYNKDSAALRRLDSLQLEVMRLRKEIAVAIDDAIHSHMLHTNDVYRNLDESIAEHIPMLKAAEEALKSERLNEATVSLIYFAEHHGLMPMFETNSLIEELILKVQTFAEEHQLVVDRNLARLRSMRDVEKSLIYYQKDA